MIELESNELIFSFPDLTSRFRHRVRAWIDARLAAATEEERTQLRRYDGAPQPFFERHAPTIRATVAFQRTLRIPDDGRDYPLPPGLGCFPVHHVDDFPQVPEAWKKRGGVMLPMHKTEALWLSFSSKYPIALKIAAGGVCAISGRRWDPTLAESPQNYVVLPRQPWLDGFRVTDGVVRQFVGVPLGEGLTVERQLTGSEAWGGLQFQAFPMKEEIFWRERLEGDLECLWRSLIAPAVSATPGVRPFFRMGSSASPRAAGLGAGGRIKQEITADPHGVATWDTSMTSRCFAHLCLADDWQALTGHPPPDSPPTASDYAHAGLAWFDFNSGTPAVAGETALSGVKSVNALVEEKTGIELPDNSTVTPAHVVRLEPNAVRLVREF